MVVKFHTFLTFILDAGYIYALAQFPIEERALSTHKELNGLQKHSGHGDEQKNS
jgi:hypothetical protein